MSVKDPQENNLPELGANVGEVTEGLVREAKAGGSAGFGGLYERIAPALYTWADIRIRQNMRAWLDPADLVQEVWCRALRAFERFDPQTTSFRFWIFRVAKNVLLEAMRKVGSAAFQAQAPGSTTRLLALNQVPDVVTGVSQRLSKHEELRRFGEWVQQLERSDRDLLVHHGLEGLTHQEVAERLQLGLEAVTKRWQRLRARLEQEALPREVLTALFD